MRLRKPCKEHGYYDAHPVEIGQFAYPDCPGGEFLPEDAEQVEMLIQALGDILVASGIRAAPMSGPELLAHSESLRLWLEEQRNQDSISDRETQ